MLTIAEDIFQDVERETTLLNGEVVRRAFEMLNKPRVDRSDNWGKMFPPYCCPYAELLERYESAETIAESAQQRTLDPLTESEKRFQPVWLIRQTRFAYAEERHQKRDELKARLSDVWPCVKCFKEKCSD